MTVLAIDPGTIVLGYCAIKPKGLVGKFLHDRWELVDHGEIYAAQKRVRTQRLVDIRHALRPVFDRLNPKAVVLERGYVGRGAQAAIAIGEARGVVIGLAATWDCAIVEYTANEARRLIGVGGRSRKSEARRVAASLLGHPSPFGEDEGDAAVLAVAFALGEKAGGDRP